VIVLVGWGALLLALTALQLVFGPATIELALLGGAGAACLIVGLVWRLRVRPAPPRRSWGTVALAAGVALAVVGAEAGTWLILLGAGLAALGLGGLVAER